MNVRASSRLEPDVKQGRLSLSFENFVEFDRNLARQMMDRLRKALHWEVAPVISDFDPKFNNNAPLWFEKFLEPMAGPNNASGSKDMF